MRIYECPECGEIKIQKEWGYCSQVCDDVAMVEVLSFGGNAISDQVKKWVTENKAQKELQKSL